MPSMDEIPNLIFHMINLAFLSMFGTVLAIKAVKKHFINVLYFSIAILIYGGFFAVKIISSNTNLLFYQIGISESVYLASLVPGIIFIKKSFYAERRRPPMVIFSTIMYVICAIISIIAGFGNDLDPANKEFMFIRYFIDDLVIFPLIFTWNVVNGLLAYNRPASFSSRIASLRFIFFAVSNIAAVASYILDYVSAFVIPELLALYFSFSIGCVFLYGIFMYITWFPPARMTLAIQDPERRLQTGTIATDATKQAPLQGPVMEQTLARATSMAVIEHFGNILATTIGQSPAACSGLLLTTIENELGADALFHMSIHDLEHVIGKSLQSRLEALGVTDSTLAIEMLKKELAANTSLLTLAMF